MARKYDKEATLAVDELWTEFETYRPSVIIKKLGIKVVESEAIDMGYSTVDGQIFVNNKLKRKVRKFIIAHELGHILLHRKSVPTVKNTLLVFIIAVTVFICR